jgi:putative transposase
MPNHVHLIAVPGEADGLRLAPGEAHRRYTRAVNARHGWVGHLWQGRFASCALDDAHLLAAARYVELNPVRARLAPRPKRWPWSSAAAHLVGRDDGLVRAAPLLDAGGGGWRAFLVSGIEEAAAERLRRHERTGRPLDGEAVRGRARGPARAGAAAGQTGPQVGAAAGRPARAAREQNAHGIPVNGLSR